MFLEMAEWESMHFGNYVNTLLKLAIFNVADTWDDLPIKILKSRSELL